MADIVNERIQYEQALADLLAAYGTGGATGGTILPERLSLINYVKAKLDEIIPEGEGLQFQIDGDINVSDPLNLLINALLNEAAKRTLLNAPLHVLDAVKSTTVTGQANTQDNKIGTIALAANFLRFVSLKMAEWKREVTIPITPDSPLYKLQSNKYTRGGLEKPVAVLTRDTSGNRVIEYYSVGSSHAISSFYYVQETSAEDLQPNLMDSLTWQAAGMILQITERVDLAKVAFDQALLSFQNL